MTFPDTTTAEVAFPQGRTYTESVTVKTRVKVYVGPSSTIEGDTPAYGAAHPTDTDLQVSQRDFAQFPVGNTEQSIATITYTLPVLQGIDEDYDMSAIQVTKYFDLDGNVIIGGAAVFEPSLIFRKRIITSTPPTIDDLAPIVGTTNNAAIFGEAQNSLLYRGATVREVVGTTVPWFIVEHTFQWNGDDWLETRQNLETGANITYRVYTETDFTTLPGLEGE